MKKSSYSTSLLNKGLIFVFMWHKQCCFSPEYVRFRHIYEKIYINESGYLDG